VICFPSSPLKKTVIKRATLILLCWLLLPLSSEASETVVLKIILNAEDKGDYFILLTEGGDALLRHEDLVAIGFQEMPKDMGTMIGQEKYLSLKSLAPRVHFEIDERGSALRITANPGMLRKNVVDLAHKRDGDVLSTRDNAAFLNYSLGYRAGSHSDLETLNFPWEAGISIGGWLGFSSFIYTNTGEDEKHVRLFSNVTWDDRTTLRRIVAGDFSAYSGNLGGGGIFGGLSLSKNFSIRPDFKRYPGVDLAGVLESSSDVELYVNDTLLRREHLPAGEFQFLNLPGTTGLWDTTLVIRDAFGRETRITNPFYVSSQLLKPGLHDYSYNFGFKREALGQESFEYGEAAFVGYHRLGLTSALTGGLRAEVDQDMTNLGCSATFIPWRRLGETNMSLAISNEEGHRGKGGTLSHFYSDGSISGSFSLRGLSREYANLGLSSSQDRPRREGTVGIGYNLRAFGAISVSYSSADYYTETDQRRASIFYSRGLWKNASVQLRASRTESDVTVNEVFASFLVFLGTGKSGGLSYRMRDDRIATAVTMQQNPPLGTGFGYRLLADTVEDDLGDRNTGGNLAVQYRAPYGVYSADYNRIAGQDIYDIRMSGGIAVIGNSAYLSRPVSDSFALVKVAGLEGVKVKYSNQEVGTTNEDGEIIVPNLISYYPNDLSIETGDLPVNYEVSHLRKYVSPPVRGGSIVNIAVTKLQGFTGRLFIVEKGERRAAQYWGLRLWVEDEPREFIVGNGGEFYLENLPAGRFRANLFMQDKKCEFDLIIPESDDVMVEMGEKSCALD